MSGNPVQISIITSPPKLGVPAGMAEAMATPLTASKPETVCVFGCVYCAESIIIIKILKQVSVAINF